MKPVSVSRFEMEAIDESFIPVALFIMLQNVVLTFESTSEVCTVEKTFPVLWRQWIEIIRSILLVIGANTS